MLYALVYILKNDTSKIDDFRQKYDPDANFIKPHITFLFPISDKKISKEVLLRHIRNVLKDRSSFKVNLKGLGKSWDHWLNLLVEEGNDEIIKIHDNLYTGILSSFLRKDLIFTPHVGIGLFVAKNSDYKVINPTLQPLNQDLYDKALQEAESLKFDYSLIINELELITLDDEAITIIKEDKLQIGERND